MFLKKVNKCFSNFYYLHHFDKFMVQVFPFIFWDNLMVSKQTKKQTTLQFPSLWKLYKIYGQLPDCWNSKIYVLFSL